MYFLYIVNKKWSYITSFKRLKILMFQKNNYDTNKIIIMTYCVTKQILESNKEI